MIVMNHHGGVGNSLFVFCLGKILALELDTDLFHGTVRDRGPSSVSDMNALSRLFPHFASLPSNPTARPGTVYTGHNIDLKRIIRRKEPRDMALGRPDVGMSFFQKYQYYAPYKELIRGDWLTVDSPYPQRDPDDLVIHLRLGDVAHDTHLRHLFPLVPFHYYEYLLRRIHFKALYLVTTEPDHEQVKLFSPYNPEIIQGDQVHDFKSIMSFNKIIIPVSTFSWWAAFLSEAREVYFPVFDHGLWWGAPDKPHLGAPDLRVKETRFIYYAPPDRLDHGNPPPRFKTRDLLLSRLRTSFLSACRLSDRLKQLVRSGQ